MTAPGGRNTNADNLIMNLVAKDEATPTLRSALSAFQNVTTEAYNTAQTLEIYNRAERNLINTLAERTEAMGESSAHVRELEAALTRIQQAMLVLQERYLQFGQGVGIAAQAIQDARTEMAAEETSIRSVTQVVDEATAAYERLVARRASLEAGASVIAGKQEENARFPHFGRGQEARELAAAMAQIQQAIKETDDELSRFDPALLKVAQAMTAGADAARNEKTAIESVSQTVRQATSDYERLTEQRLALQQAQGVIQGQMDARAGFPTFGRGREGRELAAAMDLIVRGIAETDAALAGLDPAVMRVANAMRAGADAAKLEEEAIRSISDVVREASSEYDRLTSRRDLLTRTAGILEEQQKSALAFPELGGDPTQLQNALSLVNAELEEVEAQLGVLPQGMQQLKEAMGQATAQAKQEKEALDAANRSKVSAAEANRRATSSYEQLINQLAQARRVVRELQNADQGNAATAGALAQAKKAVADYEAELAKLTPEQRVLAQATMEVVAAMRAESQAAGGATKAHDEHGRAAAKTRKHAEDLARGLSSSLFSFSLIAGGTVAVGHLIGNTLNNAAAAADKLYASIADISTLNPRLDADQLFEQITELSERAGTLSERITEIYKIAAPTALGDPENAIRLTEQLLAGSRGARQNPAAWAEAASATLRAYQLDLTETTRVQDILTYAMQNSAGQGSKLLDVWGSVTKAAAGAQTPLEENAAAMILLARHGGDLEENMRALKGAYDAMSTEQARAELESLGISTTDFQGNVVGLLSIIEQLGGRLSGLPTGERDSIISRLFNDRDVRNVMRTLISSWQEYQNTVQETYNVAGTSQQAHIDYLDTAAARTEKLNSFMQNQLEKWGQLIQKIKEAGLEWARSLDLEAQASDYVSGWADYNPEQRQAVIDFYLRQRDEQLQGGIFSGNMGRPVEITPEEFEELQAQLRHLGNAYHDSHQAAREMAAAQERVNGLMANTPIAGLVSDLTDMVREAGAANDEWLVYKDYQDQVIQGANNLQPALEGVGQRVNDIYQQSQRLEQLGAFGGFGSAQEQALANTSKELERVNLVLDRMLKQKPDAGGFWGMLATGAWNAAVQSLLGQINRLQAQAESQALDIRMQSPQYQEEVRQYEEFVRSQQGAEALEAAQDNLNATTKRYAQEVDGLQQRQQELQRAMRDNSAPDLARAYADLQLKTAALEAGTKRFDDALHDLRLELRDTEQQAKTALDPLERNLKDLQDSLDEWERGADAVTTILGDQLYELEQQAAKTRRETEYMLDPLRRDAEQTAEELQQLERELRDLQEEFEEQERVIRDDIEALEELRDTTLDPLRDEIEELNRELETLRRAEEDALRPLQDVAYEQEQALEAIRDEIEAISEAYEDQLLPLQQEYNELQREQARIERERENRDRRLSIENVAAQLAAARPGSAEAMQLSGRLAELRNEDRRMDRMGELQDQIQAIEDERDARLRSAREREEQAQDELDDTNRQIELIQRRYQLERRQIEDTLYLRERAFRDQEKQFNDQIEARRRDLREMEKTHEQTLRQKEADVALAQTRADNARKTLEDQEEIRTALQKTDDAAVEAKRNELAATEHTQEQHRRIRAESVRQAKVAYDEEKEYWDGLIGKINEKIERTQFDGSEFKRVAEQEVEDAQTNFNLIREEYQKTINKITDQINETQRNAATAVEAAKVVVDQEREKQKALSLTFAWINAINRAMKEGVPVDVGQLPPDVRAWYERMYGSQPTGDADQGIGLAPPYNPPPRDTRPPRANPEGGLPEPQPRPSQQTQMQVPGTEAGRGVGGGMVVPASVGVTVQVDGRMLDGDPMNPSTWEPIGDVIYEGVQRSLQNKHGVRIETR